VRQRGRLERTVKEWVKTGNRGRNERHFILRWRRFSQASPARPSDEIITKVMAFERSKLMA
jgi:hypothetical protein